MPRLTRNLLVVPIRCSIGRHQRHEKHGQWRQLYPIQDRARGQRKFGWAIFDYSFFKTGWSLPWTWDSRYHRETHIAASARDLWVFTFGNFTFVQKFILKFGVNDKSLHALIGKAVQLETTTNTKEWRKVSSWLENCIELKWRGVANKFML